ncbi:pilus assembly protein TadG-related protein [Lentzea sp. NPDC042327]|uniref:pilus assembly protein TadG-related protein n=1 Tax=Lentzea sp. NPDC042327 TaxID=3154801 RepID=UPI0033CFE6F6
MTAFLVALTASLLALAGLVLDGGLALATKVQAAGAAEAAARAGAQAIDLNAYRLDDRLELAPNQAVSRARAHLSAAGVVGEVTVSGNTVTVVVTTSQRTQLLGLVGISNITVRATGHASPHRGVAPSP